MLRRFVLASSVLFATSPLLGQEITQETRNAVGRLIGAGVVLSSAEFVGGGSFDTDTGGTIRVRHLPAHHSFGAPGRRHTPWLTLALGHVSNTELLDIAGEPFDRGKFSADSLAAIAGVELELGSGWYLEPSLGVIYSRIEVDLDYRNPLTETARPELDGVLFNWEADAWTLWGATLLGHRHDWPSGVGIDLAAQGVGLWVDPVNTDHPVQNTSTDAGYLRLLGRLRLPTGIEVRGSELYFVPEAVHSLLSSQLERSLDSDALTQLGLRLVGDIPDAPPDASLLRRLLPRALGVSAGYTTADGLSGWTFGVTFRSWASGW